VKAPLGLLLFLAAGCRYYRLETRPSNVGKADVIIVPGMELAADGRGHSILWNRMLAAELALKAGEAPRIIVTGGKPKNGVTEAQRMLEYARELDFPDGAILAEHKARSSVENARFAADLMVEQGMRSALVLSDRRHLRYAIPVFRDAFEERGLTLYWRSIDYDRLRATGRSRDPKEPPR